MLLWYPSKSQWVQGSVKGALWSPSSLWSWGKGGRHRSWCEPCSKAKHSPHSGGGWGVELGITAVAFLWNPSGDQSHLGGCLQTPFSTQHLLSPDPSSGQLFLFQFIEA